eukprot:509507-Prymnesium_polylepis.1
MYTAPPVCACEFAIELPLVSVTLPSTIHSAPPPPDVTDELAIDVRYRATLPRIDIAPPKDRVRPLASLIESSLRNAPRSTSNSRDRCLASIVAPAPSEAIRRLIGPTTMGASSSSST